MNEFAKNPCSSTAFCAGDNKSFTKIKSINSKESEDNLMEKRGSAENVVQRTVKLSNGKVEQKNDVKIIDLNELRLPILIDSAVDNYPTEHFTEGVTGRNLNWSY